jgi:hypothetical protein
MLALSLASVVAWACGSSSSTPGPQTGDGGSAVDTGTGGRDGGCGVEGFTGLTLCGADAGSPRTCGLSMPTQGGLPGPLCAGPGGTFCATSRAGAGDGGIEKLDWSTTSTGSTTPDSLVVAVFSSPVPNDQLGTFSASLEITQQLPNDGGTISWKTPGAVCSFTIAGSTCLATQQRVVSGTGTCSQAAAPEPGNTTTPVTIGDFTFNAD